MPEVEKLPEPFYRLKGDPTIHLNRAPVVVGVGTSEVKSGLFIARILKPFFGPETPILIEAVGSVIDDAGTVDLGGPTHHALSAIEDFVSGKRKARIGGRTNSTAIVMHGPPGNGKTWAAAKGVALAQKSGAIVLMPSEADRDMDGWNAMKVCTDILRNEGIDAPIIWWVDDVPEKMWKEKALEEFLIANFDGRQSRDNVALVCTTNFGYAMPQRFWNRPSRCTSIPFGPPTEEMLKKFFAAKGVGLLPTLEGEEPKHDGEVIDSYVKAVYGQSLDAAANLVFTVQSTGMSLQSLSRDQEIRKALAERRVDYGVVSEVMYGKLLGATDPVTLPDGKVIDPVSMEPMDASEAEEEDEEKSGLLFPDLTRGQLEQLAMSIVLSGLAVDPRGRTVRSPQEAVSLLISNGGLKPAGARN